MCCLQRKNLTNGTQFCAGTNDLSQHKNCQHKICHYTKTGRLPSHRRNWVILPFQGILHIREWFYLIILRCEDILFCRNSEDMSNVGYRSYQRPSLKRLRSSWETYVIDVTKSHSNIAVNEDLTKLKWGYVLKYRVTCR